MIAAAFWFLSGVIAWVYVLFPLTVVVIGRLRNRCVRRAPVTPKLSLVIAAFDEEARIAQRLENALRSDYPEGALEILVASDGSSDRTEEIVASFEDRGVRLLRLPRQGKIPALDAAVRASTGEIIVFSDANTVADRKALRALARNFADPEVGAVAGNTGYRIDPGAESSSHGEGLYWRYDTWLKEMESRTGSVVSAHGGLHAIRRALYESPPESAVTDDFVISTAAIRRGRRLVFEREARAWEVAVPKAAGEFRRRVRLMTRGLRAVSLRRELLNPARHGFYSIVLFSHKVLRRLVAPMLPLLLVLSVVLVPTGGVYSAAAGGQLVFYGLAAAGALSRKRRLGRSRLLYIPFYFCLANAAAFVALVRFLRGDRIRLWQPQRQAAGA